MSAPKRKHERDGSAYEAFDSLIRAGINPYLLCGAVCSVEQVWNLTPAKPQALRKAGVSVKDAAKLPERLRHDASSLRVLRQAKLFGLPDGDDSRLCGLMKQAAAVLENNLTYAKQTEHNIRAAALVELLREIDSAREWAGFPVRTNVEPSLAEQAVKREPHVATYALASDLMRQGVPNEVLEKMRADFPVALGRVPAFPSGEALRGRIRTIKRTPVLREKAQQLCEDWKWRYAYQPFTWVKGQTPKGPPPPLAMLCKTST